MTIVEHIQEYLTNAGLGDPFSQAFLVVALMVLFSIMLFKADAPSAVFILVNSFVFILGIVLDFIPMWILLLVFMIVFAYIVMILFDFSPDARGKKGKGE